ncbi:MAG: BirA family transcriptional regulator [Micromonosporaceae bacterium]|nr:BirA family transcriptional regulator [Micromonosporaceae bacterium]
MNDGRYADLGRPPLNPTALRRALVVPGGLWTDVAVVAETGSTNADVAAAARAGTAEGLVVVAEGQTAGRGRQGRTWQSPARAGIAASVLLRPAGVDPARYGWLPLLAGVALAEAVRRVGDVDAVLKWPNDLLIDGRKCAGVLVEVAVPGAVVVGFGLNTTLSTPELPGPQATSLALAGAACVDRDPLLRAALRALAAWYGRWREAAGDAVASGVAEAYAFHCATVGRQVRVELPGGDELCGRADAVDAAGRLVVDGRPLAAGDVAHLR